VTVKNVEETAHKTYSSAQEMVGKSVKAWTELIAVSTDMAYEMVLKNWNYSRSIRSSAEQAIEDALNTQARFAREMMGVWKDYAEASPTSSVGPPGKSDVGDALRERRCAINVSTRYIYAPPLTLICCPVM